MTQSVMPEVCDYCLDAAYDLGARTLQDQVMVATEMGADLPDHLCDVVELMGEEDVECSCGCRSR